MPPYEITCYFRPLQKEMLVDAIKKTVTTLLDQGGVIIDLHSLGYRDLPVQGRTKLTNEKVYTCNSILFNTSMPKDSIAPLVKQLKLNNDLIRYGIINPDKTPMQPSTCNLEEMLKTPAYRKSVDELRKRQRMSHVMALKVYRKARRSWQNIPKSYFTPPAKR